VLRFVASYLSMVVPPVLGAPAQGLITEIYGRIIIITWGHLLGGIMYTVLFATVLLQFPNVAELQATLLGISMPGKATLMMAIKMTMTVMTRWRRTGDDDKKEEEGEKENR
jgi:hypothetical protein